MQKQAHCSIRIFVLIAVMCTAIISCSQSSAVTKSEIRENEKTATLKVSKGRMRSEPSQDAPVISELKKGDTVSVIEEKNGWYHIKTQDGKTGWSHQSVFSMNSSAEDAGFKELREGCN